MTKEIKPKIGRRVLFITCKATGETVTGTVLDKDVVKSRNLDGAPKQLTYYTVKGDDGKVYDIESFQFVRYA